MSNNNNDIRMETPEARSVSIRKDSPRFISSTRGEPWSFNDKEEDNMAAAQQPPHNDVQQERPWHATMDTIQELPRFYQPMGRTAIALDTPPEVITAQIAEFNRLNSITTCVHHTNAGRADCRTFNMLKFVIQLWRKPIVNDENPRVLVEVLRRQGCSVEMMKIRHELFHTLQTGDITAPDTTLGNVEWHPCEQLKRMIRLNRSTLAVSPAEQESKLADKNLQIIIRLLESPRLDQNRLGLESLRAATDCSVSCATPAKLTSRALVFGEGRHGVRLQNLLVPYFRDNRQPRGGAKIKSHHSADDYDSDEEEMEETEYAQGSTFGAMHNLALQALANAQQTLVKRIEQNSIHCNSNAQCRFWKQIEPSLEYNLQVANSRPQEAAMSVKCIRLQSRLMKACCKESRIFPLLVKANRYGKVCHASLEQETESFMGQILADRRTIHASG